MYYPPVFAPVRPFDPRANPLETPVGRPDNPLDLSVKTIRPPSDSATGGAEADELLMLDHRKLANLAASHSLSAMGRQLIDPSLYRLGYGAEAVIPGLAATPFCFDRTTGVAVPTSLAGHQMMTTFLQQRERLEQQQQAFLAARNSVVAQQQVAAAAAAYMDPLHLRNGLTQREAAAALAATRGLYAPTLPTPMMLPAFSLYTEDKGAFTSLRNPVVTNVAGERSSMNGVPVSTPLEAARYAEHFQRLREQQLQHHQPSGKCSSSGSCCASSNASGLGQSSVPCACCVQTPSQAALCARSPMGCSAKDPTAAATGKVCDLPQPGQTQIYRPTVTTSSSAPTTTATTFTTPNELRLSVSSLCTTHTTAEPTTVNSIREKQHSSYRPPAIWNAGLPSASNGGKTAFSVPKKKENSYKDPTHHSKEHRSNGSIKDILKDTLNNNPSSYDASKCDAMKLNTKHDSFNKVYEKHSNSINEEFAMRYQKKEVPDYSAFNYHKNSVITSTKSNHSSNIHNGVDLMSMNKSTIPVSSRSDSATMPVTKMPPLLEAVHPSEMQVPMHDQPRDNISVQSPQGPPLLVAVSSSADHSVSTVIKPPYVSSGNSVLKLTSSIYNNHHQLPVPSFKHQSEKQNSDGIKVSSSKSPKKTTHSSSKYNGVPLTFANGEHSMVSASLPKPIPAKPIPQLPTHHLSANAAHYSSHYRPAQHQLNLQTHNEWIPHANPNVTVAPFPQVVTTTSVTTSSTTVTSNSNRVNVKSQQQVQNVVKREPDYADTPNVLQSLLVKCSAGMESSASSSVADVTNTTSTSLPLFSLDYRFPIASQMNFAHYNHEVLSSMPLNGTQAHHHGTVSKDKVVDLPKSNSSSHSTSSIFKNKKRSNCIPVTEENQMTKKRILQADFNTPMARYSFQGSSFQTEMPEAPDCPYTFVPEPPLNYATQIKLSENQKPLWRDLSERSQDVAAPRLNMKSPVPVPVLSRRRVRRRLLSGICRPFSVEADRAAVDRQLTVRYARKLLSQLTLRWAHRRYLHKWHAMRRKKITTKHKVDVRKEKDLSCDLVMPPEMKKLMVNKALGETQLHRAARLGYPQAVAYCLKSKCVKVNVRDNAGYTPLHECCSRGHLDIARALLQYGADVNASAAGGIRPLHDAVENDHVEIVRLLLSYGADPTLSTYSGMEPLKLARSAMMAELLQGFMSDVSGEVDTRPHLPWKFWGSSRCLDPEESGFDVLSGVPSDPESEAEGDNDFLFEVSDSPHLPTFRLLPPAANTNTQCNYLRLSDVLRKLSLHKDEFVAKYSHIEILSLSRHEFEASATCSPMPQPDKQPDTSTTDLVKLDNHIRKVLGIETISVR